MGRTFLLSSFAALLASSAVPANATQLITNGNFSAGLTGWTSFTTPNGTITEIPSLPGAPVSPQVAAVKSYNVTGSGANEALYLHAGVYLPPYNAGQEGGGVIQTFTSGAGLASFSASIAAYARIANNAGGILSVFIDDILMTSLDFGAMGNAETKRGMLAFSTNLSAGTHTLKLQATRQFGPSNISDQYFDNVSLDGVAAAAVPEPASWALMIGGLGLVGLQMRRRTATISFA